MSDAAGFHWSDESADAQNELDDFIRRHAVGIGPEKDLDLGPSLCAEWVLVSNWVAESSGESYIMILGSNGLLRSHKTGLLVEALFMSPAPRGEP